MAGKHSKSIFDIRLKPIKFKNPITAIRQLPKNKLPFVIITLFLVVSLVVSLCFVGGYFISGNKQQNILADSAETFRVNGGNQAIKQFSAKNQDIVGWINIENTNICYPICQSVDDTYYLNHNQFGSKSRYGALFLSASDSFERNNDKNIVIYGNNIKNGAMFGNLDKYRNINFYKQNPCIDIYYGDWQEKYVVFAVMLVSSSEDDALLYKPYKSFFADEKEFNSWHAETRKRSIINSPIQLGYNDEILTLVTSAKDFDGARLVVMAKKITDWDASHTDVSDATISKDTKYPKIWYTSRGQEYPY